MSFIPKPHEIYKHFKGNLYQITAIAEHTETGEQLVIYQALYGDFKTYARPLSMFVSRVDRMKYPDAEQEFRFELQGPEAGRQREESSEPLCGKEINGPETAKSTPQSLTASSKAAGDTRKESAAGSEAAGDTRKESAAGSKAAGDTRKESAASGEAAGSSRRSTDIKASAEIHVQLSGEEPSEGELALDPMVLEFLDADDYEQRLNILAGLHHRITDDMITTMAIACDVEINDGDTEERYEALKTCLLTLERYECNRLR